MKGILRSSSQSKDSVERCQPREVEHPTLPSSLRHKKARPPPDHCQSRPRTRPLAQPSDYRFRGYNRCPTPSSAATLRESTSHVLVFVELRLANNCSDCRSPTMRCFEHQQVQ